MLLTPPQVVEVDCPSNAMLVVRWLDDDRIIFPNRKAYIAKAQFEGRTIAINARDFQYVSDAQRVVGPHPGMIDLVTVMLHEFGHCVGLGHAPHGIESVMAEIDPAASPTDYDYRRFVAILQARVVGGTAGEFNVAHCSGLRAPSHWALPDQ
jgi:hypothetical protein